MTSATQPMTTQPMRTDPPTIDASSASRRGLAVVTSQAVKLYGSGETEVRALDGVSVGIEAHRFTVIMGPSGCGKSTLLHCMAGLDRLSDGEVHLDGLELGSLTDDQLAIERRSKIGFVFQSFNLVSSLSVAENLVLPMTLAGTKPDRAWYDHVVQVVGLGDRVRHRPAELSGGQRQRVAVARALIAKPSVIFADEPTGNLDSGSGAAVLSFLRKSVDELSQTVVMVTHDPTAASYGHRCLFLSDGKIADDLVDPSSDVVSAALAQLAVARPAAGEVLR